MTKPYASPALVVLLLGGMAAPAAAAPRVGLVVLAHEGLSDEAADDTAYELAGAIATQIGGEAMAGSNVRDELKSPPDPSCADHADCARDLATKLSADEVLLLVFKKLPEKGTQVTANRVPRDPDRDPGKWTFLLPHGKTRRGRAITENVSKIYATGSVVAYVPPPPPPPPPVVVAPPTAAVPEMALKADKPKAKEQPLYKKAWLWGAVAGGVVVVAGVTVGLVYALQPGPSAPSIMLPQ